ncbi:MAG: pyridoxamine 5'-phosphate oxidase family protein [Pseudomonadota bacterium]
MTTINAARVARFVKTLCRDGDSPRFCNRKFRAGHYVTPRLSYTTDRRAKKKVVRMGKDYTEIDERIQKWMSHQFMYFVATAPLSGEGLINCSPKGGDTLRVLGPRQVAYVDYGGSGIETVAHLKENGRITLMLCAFDGPPKIFRFFGRGSVIEPHDERFDELLTHFPPPFSARTIILIDVDRIMDSCGYGVPEYTFVKHRESMQNWIASKTDEEIADYRRERNGVSLDGLPGLSFDEQ